MSDNTVTARALQWMAMAADMRIEQCCEVEGAMHNDPDDADDEAHWPSAECDELPRADVLDRIRVLSKDFAKGVDGGPMLHDRVASLKFSLRDLVSKVRAGHDSQDPERCNLCRALKFCESEVDE